MGSTGDSPVPVGDSPTGRSRRLLSKGPSLLPPGALPAPPGESPGGTGQWPVPELWIIRRARTFMKCSNHTQADAVASCVFCGQGLCPSCITRSTSGRVVCSPRCAERATAMEIALETIRQKTLNSGRLVAYFLFAAAFVFNCVGVYEIIEALSTGTWVMALFLPGIGVVFIAAGIGYLRLAKSKT
jgi:hypothetical protein